MAVGFVVAPQLQESLSLAVRGIPALQDAPAIRDTFEGGKRISYGARAITEGGWQSVPKLSFPGGALIGCSAGFVNVPRIKGAQRHASGMLAAEARLAALAAGRANDELVAYEDAWRDRRIGKDLKKVRNVKPLWSKFGTVHRHRRSAASTCGPTRFGFSLFGTPEARQARLRDARPGRSAEPIDYPKPDGVLTFDRLSSVFLSNTNHEEDQPVHLKVADMDLQKRSEHDVFAGPSQPLLPGRRLRMGRGGVQVPNFVINAQNCVHCKTCDIKDPNQNINWVPPQGGGGPNYAGM